MSALRAEKLFKTYRSRNVVNDVSMHINSGEVVGLLGPNGAGKTTSFYMMVGLISADAGHIYLDDTDISHFPMHRRARLGIGYLPQEASVFRKLSVEDNIRAILESMPGLSAEQIETETEELLRELHISHIRDSLGMSLSGGERRRVEIARALATRPDFILLDEPFAGVDPLSVVDINSIINHLRELGIGVLITDHNVRETLGICERAYIMNAGAIIAEGDPESLLADKQVREVYLGQHFTL
ncbi:LPS export ABC transporter ATP-binding protein [Sulfuriflexus mobilis]|uniref:LPS export ABC transporter ATP-binding protein n=1 Tax=Sulfuriflexus mobilis TaxID=1811807 RepID=UPI000F831E6C|nr:LPS export ABC transporter ATP-binding protein [Sulfuriflexus mobilis]